MEDKKIFVGKSLRVFVSYSNEDQNLAHRLKIGLEHFGLDVFLAHDDIPGGTEWEYTIIKTIKQSDIFLQLLTENFKNSEWTDQETGIAISNDKMIIPLKVDIDPYGFTKKIQAFKLKYETIKDETGEHYHFKEGSFTDIIDIIFENIDLREQLKDCLIRVFVKSSSFQDARDKAGKLIKFNNFSGEQIEEIVRGSIFNRQIHDSTRTTRTFLNFIIEKYGEKIDNEKVKQLKELIESK